MVNTPYVQAPGIPNYYPQVVPVNQNPVQVNQVPVNQIPNQVPNQVQVLDL
jgi:hypothetical protein